MPMGAQRTAVPDRSRLSLEAVADALVAVGRAVTDQPLVLVGNDTGGAVAQIATARHPEDVAGLLLAPCEVFEHLPPRGFGLIKPLLTRPAAARTLVRAFALPPILSRPGPLNLLTRRGVDRALVRSWMAPATTDREVAADLARLFESMRPAATLQAADALGRWAGRTAIVWSRSGVVFPPRDARRMAAHLGVAVTWVDDASALLPLDAPEAVATALLALLDEIAADRTTR